MKSLLTAIVAGIGIAGFGMVCAADDGSGTFKVEKLPEDSVGLKAIGQSDEIKNPKPLLRDLKTGYLLNCFFMTPRPYCWRSEILLSGWEVDRSGGRFEFSPNFEFSTTNTFDLHIDWFKLVDTSASGAITLRYQIARQTEGKLTLEFRFMLPAASLGRRMILLANWNEFGEGHFMLPTESARFGYLDALREVFTEGGAHEDLTPTELQKKRFNVLYPRD